MKILGIESSCDETSASVVEDGKKLLSNVVSSSMNLHAIYGGVIPEIAARSHIEVIIPVIDEAMKIAKCTWDDIDGIAVTYGAGLGGSLLVGVMTARTLAIIKNKPLYKSNHVLGHVYANFITESSIEGYSPIDKSPDFPFLAVIVSGGHSQLVLFKDHFDYQLLGKTQDDAIGEAFDKVAKILGLGYPGGPAIAIKAGEGDPTKYKLPIANMERYDFSFSGIKTAVLRLAQNEIGESYNFPSTKLSERLNESQKANIAASFQYTAVKTIVDKVKKAVIEFNVNNIVIAGGVGANQELRKQLKEAFNFEINYPDIKVCTDNGGMIATLGCYQAKYKKGIAIPEELDIEPNLVI